MGYFGPIGVSAVFYQHEMMKFLHTQVKGPDGEVRQDAQTLLELVRVIVWFVVLSSAVRILSFILSDWTQGHTFIFTQLTQSYFRLFMACQSLYTNVAFISSGVLSQERPKDCLFEILLGTRNSTFCPVLGSPSWKVTWRADSRALPDQGRHSVGYVLRGMKRRNNEEP
jgi:hypothetical protein